MLKAILNRSYLPKQTIGHFTMFDESYSVIFKAASLELPWKNNKPFISCISKGFYICEKVASNSYGEIFEVKDVEGRTLIYIHWGNYTHNYKGCIGLGKNHAYIDNDQLLDITDTKNTIGELMAICDKFELEIV